jgi:uncharacterized membrane protein YgcG
VKRVRSLAALFLFVACSFMMTSIVGLPAAGAQTSDGTVTDPSERLERLQIVAVVTAEGSLHVTERITWNFGYGRKHGIFRYVPFRRLVDADAPGIPNPKRTYKRVTKIRWRDVTSSSGAPTSANVSEKDDISVLRIGDANRFISGRHTYDITYDIERAVVGGLLQYTAVGEGWAVPVDNVSIKLRVPIKPGAKPVCLRSNSSATCEASVTVGGGEGGGSVVEVNTTGIGIEIEVPVADSIKSPTPQYELIRTFADGFATSGASGAVNGLAGIAAVVGAVLAGRKGRDRTFANGGILGAPGDAERPLRMRERIASPVEFEPPEGIRPGLIEPARTGVSSQRCISSMVVDLAARKVLQIEPINDGQDHALHYVGTNPESLTTNEQQLLGALFRGQNDGTVTTNELSTRIDLAGEMAAIRNSLVHEAVEKGWWLSNPVNVRRKWRFIGFASVVLGLVLAFFLMAATGLGFVGLALSLFGVGVMGVAQLMPVRTATGSRIAARLKGFELLFDAGEGDRLKLAEKQNLFAEYLPYAMAFGNVDKWVKTFAKMGVENPSVPYYGPMGLRGGYGAGYYPGAFGHGGGFDRAMSDFDRSLNRSIEAGAAAERARQAAESRSNSSSSGGSFGGGGSSGGGGGGSW